MRLSAYYEPFCHRPIPSELLDMIDNLPPSHKNNPNHYNIFEAMIFENTGNDEPNAPRITVSNGVDEEPSPSMSFYYTNNLYHGPGIKPSSFFGPEGCDCKGACDPLNQSCACVRRQEAFTKEIEGFDDHKGFMYNIDGTVKDHGLPIFECNLTCRCSDACMNRVSRMH